MKVLVDTSVWVEFFRGRGAALREALGALLDDDSVIMAAPVRVELLGGVRKDHASKVQKLLSALPTFAPSEATWGTMESWALRGARAGQRFGLGDLLIGAIATEQGCSVWSLDADFRRLAELGVVVLHDPSSGGRA